MNFNKKGINTTIVALTIVLIVVIVAAAAYIAVSPGKTNTVTQTTTKTNTVTSLSTSTSISTSVTTATSASPTYYPLTLQAGGSTFVNPVMQVWAQSFKQFTNGIVQTNYQSVGSGSGITGIEQGTFMFAGSDAPLTTSQWEPYSATAGLNGSLLQIPETLGGVAIFYNLPGVTAHLNFTGPIIADIYVGKIPMWNDPAITTLNPSITFPAQNLTALRSPTMTVSPVLGFRAFLAFRVRTWKTPKSRSSRLPSVARASMMASSRSWTTCLTWTASRPVSLAIRWTMSYLVTGCPLGST
jgi:phosphate transport system substrate-binding protein